MTASENPISPTEEESAGNHIAIRWTPFGWIFCGLGVVFFTVGMWRVDGVMAAMGLAAGLLLVLARWVGKSNLRNLTLGYRGPRRVEVAKGFEGKLELLSGKRALDGFGLEFGMRFPEGKEITGRSKWISSGGVAMVPGRLSLKQRGLFQRHKGWIRSTFPFGLMAFRRDFSVMAEIGVVPVGRIPKELGFSGFQLEGLPLGASRRFGETGEWKGLREWRSGDAVRKIAWAPSLKSEAAGGGLLVRQDEPPGSQAESCALVFHSYGGDGELIRPDRFEIALSLLCGVTACLQAGGIPIRILADFREWEPLEVRSKRCLARFKEELMLVKRARWSEAHDLTGVFAGVGTKECLVVISDMPAASWKALIPKRALEPVVVDISNYDKSKRRGFLKQERRGL
jgi:uncharacterized protein (DUF58 family)